MSQTSGVYDFDNPVATTDQLNYRIEGLTPGETYYFIVHAQDAKGNEDENEIEIGSPITRIKEWYQIVFHKMNDK